MATRARRRPQGAHLDKPPADSHRKLGIAVAGFGQWGRNLVRNFSRIAGRLVVHDSNDQAARACATAHGGEVMSWTELLADSAIDAVVLATPAPLHGPMAGQALDAGKHVFVEKPLTLDADQAEALCEVAERRRRVLMVGHLMRYHPAFVALKEMVRGGTLGRLQYIYSNRLNLGRFRKEENILWSFAPHDVSMILALAGSRPEQVTAVGACYLHPTIADTTTTHLSFSDGTRAHIYVSWLHPFREQKLVVIGDRAMAVFDDGQEWAGKLRLYRHRIDWHNGMPAAGKVEPEAVALVAEEPLRLECQHFVDCILAGQTPRTCGREGVEVLRLLQAAQRSMTTGRPERPSGLSIHETAWIDQPCAIGTGTRIWHFAHILAGSRIGRNCTIGQNVVIGPDVTIGDTCKIQNNVSLYKGVTLEDGVFCGPSCVFTNVHNPRAEVPRMDEVRPTLVRRGATIGANATIICGVTLGAWCFIGAGAVVSRDVPDHALMTGTPARRIGWMSRAGGRLGPDLICPIEGRRYRENGPDRLVEITGDSAP